MTRKALFERKQDLLSIMEAMVNKAQLETRELDAVESSTYEIFKEEVNQITDELNKFIANEVLEDKKEELRMMETKNYADELLQGRPVELRAMDTATKGEVVPVNLYDQITKKIAEKSGIVAEIKTVESVGDMEFLVEGEIGEATFLSETGTVAPKDLEGFEKVKLSDKRLATSVLVSKKLLNNSPAITESYLADIIAERIANALEKELFADVASENGFTHTLLTDAASETGSLTIDALMALIVSMKESHLKGAKLVMNRAMFAKVCALRDANNRFYVVPAYDHATGGPAYSILGVSIKISEYAPANKIVLVNVNGAGIMKNAGGLKLIPLVEKYAENGQVAIIAEQFCDFGVLNKECVKVLNVQTGRAKAA